MLDVKLREIVMQSLSLAAAHQLQQAQQGSHQVRSQVNTRGAQHLSTMAMEIAAVCEQQVHARVRHGWSSLHGALRLANVAYDAGLGAELKGLMRSAVPLDVADLRAVAIEATADLGNGAFRAQTEKRLDDAWAHAIADIEHQIDLFVMDLRAIAVQRSNNQAALPPKPGVADMVALAALITAAAAAAIFLR